MMDGLSSNDIRKIDTRPDELFTLADVSRKSISHICDIYLKPNFNVYTYVYIFKGF